ncbi:GGDEF domain-containing protein [Pseudomonadota bacterium]
MSEKLVGTNDPIDRSLVSQAINIDPDYPLDQQPALKAEIFPVDLSGVGIRLLRFVSLLQTTLELEHIIGLYFHELNKSISVDGLLYEHIEQDIEIAVGDVTNPMCSYHTIVGDGLVGQIVYCRNRQFSQVETIELKWLLASLAYPILNALQYRDALEFARKDPLTGIYNRAALEEAMDREVNFAHRHKSELSLIILDIDSFKSINDKYGHTVGDAVLLRIVTHLTGVVRKSDFVARYGGEEFIVLMGSTDSKGALVLAQRILEKVASESVIENGEPIKVTVSLGISSLNSQDNPKSLLERADKNLYRAKLEGRNRICADV